MDEILNKSGIQRRLKTVYTPEQNGVAERKNRTLVESARCMLIQSELPPSFWAEAIATANHIKNRCITKSLNEGTPYKKWTGKRPNFGYLRTFECKVDILDKTPNKDMFEPKILQGTFVDYFDTSKAYRVWITSEWMIRVSRDVRFFDEFENIGRYDDIVSENTVNGRFIFHEQRNDAPNTRAYLDGKIDTKIFMQKLQLLKEMLKGSPRRNGRKLFDREKNMLQNLHGGNKVRKLKKALYGLRQAGRQCHAELDKTLLKIGLIPFHDPCVYVDENRKTYVPLYVDDMLIISNDKERERQIKSELPKAFTFKDLGEENYCLGIEIDRTMARLCVSQSGYIRDILNEFGMSEGKPVSTPLAPGTKLSVNSEKEDCLSIQRTHWGTYVRSHRDTSR